MGAPPVARLAPRTRGRTVRRRAQEALCGRRLTLISGALELPRRYREATMSPSISLLGKPRPCVHVGVYTGLFLGFVQSAVLVSYLGLWQLTLFGITGVVILTFLGLTMITKVISVRDLIIYYHHEIAVIVMVTVFLRLTGQPALPYLDVTILGVGLFLAVGRVGCLMAGCCYGRPWRWGVTYGHEHVAAGFAEHLAGVRLFPIQIIESGFALLIVVTGIGAILEGYPPG